MSWSGAYKDAFSTLGEQTFTVSQFLDMINELVAPLNVTIQGEITSFNVRGQFIYATISDLKEQAKLNLFIVKSTLDRAGIVLEEGMEVIVQGIPGIYKGTGNFNLRVTQLTPVGEGALKKAFDRLVAKLETEGLFNPSLKRPIPEFPVHIGVISSVNGDALADFRKHLLPFNLKIHFVDARVEGVNSIASVTDALRALNESTVPLDVIVVTRGGGSLESLQAFNSEPVARAIRSSRVPVISAIGHEQDVTIADYVADKRASTPTDAAKILSLNWSQASERVTFFESSLQSNFRKSFGFMQQRVSNLAISMVSQYQRNLSIHQNTVEHVQRSAMNYLHTLQFISDRLVRDHEITFKTFQTTLQERSNHLANEIKTLEYSMHTLLKQSHKQLGTLEQMIMSNDPHNKLKQGYSIVMNAKDKVIRSSEQVKLGDEITITLYKGNIKSIIKKKS